MNANVGSFDRTMRIIGGILILALGYYYSSWWGLVGLVPLGTGLFGRCALYSVFGVSTCRAKQKAAKS
jgi:hypothetical protein